MKTHLAFGSNNCNQIWNMFYYKHSTVVFQNCCGRNTVFWFWVFFSSALPVCVRYNVWSRFFQFYAFFLTFIFVLSSNLKLRTEMYGRKPISGQWLSVKRRRACIKQRWMSNITVIFFFFFFLFFYIGQDDQFDMWFLLPGALLWM